MQLRVKLFSAGGSTKKFSAKVSCMKEACHEDNNYIGDNIRKIRQEKGLRLQDLARITGISISFLSNTERGKVNPSIDTLSKISRALDTSLVEITSDINQVYIIRSDKRKTLKNPDSSVIYQLLNEGGYMRVMLCSLRPGETSSEDFHSHDGEACGYVLSGQISVKTPTKTVVLEEGDSIGFNCKVPHYFANESNTPSSIIWSVLLANMVR